MYGVLTTNDKVVVNVGDYVSDNSEGETYIITDIREKDVYMDILAWNDETDNYDKTDEYRALTHSEFKHKISFN